MSPHNLPIDIKGDSTLTSVSTSESKHGTQSAELSTTELTPKNSSANPISHGDIAPIIRATLGEAPKGPPDRPPVNDTPNRNQSMQSADNVCPRKQGFSSKFKRPFRSSSQNSLPATAPMPFNIIVCGSIGSGKSSLVNMLIGNNRAETSNTSGACTIARASYDVLLFNRPCRIWDTPGFNEADYTVSATINALIDVYRLTRSRIGESLLIYCMRGRVNAAMITNYNTLVAFCGDRVHIALVVTGLDFVDNKKVWWEENSGAFIKAGLHFDGQACVISTKDADHHGNAYEESCKAVRSMIIGLIQGHGTVGVAKAHAGGVGHKIGFSLLFPRELSVLYRGLRNNGVSRDAAREATKRVESSPTDTTYTDERDITISN